MNDQQLSVLPEDYIQRRRERRTNVMCIGLFAVVLAGLVGAYVVSSTQRRGVLEEQRRINAAYTSAAKRISELDQLHANKQTLMRKAKVTASLIEPVPRSVLLAELVNRMPEGVSFVELKLTSEKMAAETATVAIGGNGSALSKAKDKDKQKDAEPAGPQPIRYHCDLQLIGAAQTDIQVAQYMASLARCPLLDEVDLVYSEEKRAADRAERRFRIDLTIDPGADARKIDPLRVAREGSEPVDVMTDGEGPVDSIDGMTADVPLNLENN
jgi:hypothetical protein